MSLYLKKLSLFLALALIITLLIELGLRFAGIPHVSNHNIYAKSQNLIPLIDSNTILILGDSRLEWGIKPIVLEEKLEGKFKVINLALPISNGLSALKYLRQENIYPKLIILGYTPNYGIYQSHGLNTQHYSIKNRLMENARYFLSQNSYLYDLSSLKLFFAGKTTYFKSHEYDYRGGAYVQENGNYEERKKVQYGNYKKRSDTFNPDYLNEYAKAIGKTIKELNTKGTMVVGLYMPVSTEVYKLEELNYDKTKPTLIFNKFYDLSNYVYTHNKVENDSNYFYDGSHLNQQYAISFTQALADTIRPSLQ